MNSILNSSTSINDFLSAAAAKQPTPGGGSIAALAGALAVSMGEMVVNYSIGRKGLESHQSLLTESLAELHRARGMFQQLMVEDQLAFESLSRIRKLPESDPTRAASLPAAMLACIRIPETVAATAAAVIDIADRIVDKVNPHLLSDLAVCVDLSLATVRCAATNVRVNLPDLNDPTAKKSFESEMTRISTHALTLTQRVSPRIWSQKIS